MKTKIYGVFFDYLLVFNLNKMKKLLLIFILLFSFILPITTFWWESSSCNVKIEDIEKDQVWTSLNRCLGSSELVNWNWWEIETWFKTKINKWTANLATFFWILAVWVIVYWWILMTLTWWEEEKIKKAKEIVKWWIIWFLAIICASTVIVLIVNIMYSLEV